MAAQTPLQRWQERMEDEIDRNRREGAEAINVLTREQHQARTELRGEMVQGFRDVRASVRWWVGGVAVPIVGLLLTILLTSR